MFVIRDRVERLDYWRDFWAEVDTDVDDISSTEVYPLFPTDRYIDDQLRMLECGCGMGRVVKHYAARGHDVVGMDYEQACIERLHRQRGTLKLYTGDVHRLPHPDASFDAVLAFGTLSNLPDASGPLREIHRTLRPGGLLVASVTNDSLLRRLLTYAGYLRPGARHFSMVAYRRREWHAVLEQHGFEVVETAPIVTRLPIYTFLPFLRSSKRPVLEWTEARDGDRGLALNPVGEWVFRAAFKYVPFFVSHGVVGVGRKR